MQFSYEFSVSYYNPLPFWKHIFSKKDIPQKSIGNENKYRGTSLKRTLTGQKFLSALERCPPWRGLNWKVRKFKARLFYTVPTLTRTLPPFYITMEMWSGAKEVVFFCNVSIYLTSKVKVVRYFLLLSISDHNVLQFFTNSITSP